MVAVPYFVSVIEWRWSCSWSRVVTKSSLTVMIRGIIVVIFIIIVVVEPVVAVNATGRGRLVSSCGLSRLEVIVAALPAE